MEVLLALLMVVFGRVMTWWARGRSMPHDTRGWNYPRLASIGALITLLGGLAAAAIIAWKALM